VSRRKVRWTKEMEREFVSFQIPKEQRRIYTEILHERLDFVNASIQHYRENEAWRSNWDEINPGVDFVAVQYYNQHIGYLANKIHELDQEIRRDS